MSGWALSRHAVLQRQEVIDRSDTCRWTNSRQPMPSCLKYSGLREKRQDSTPFWFRQGSFQFLRRALGLSPICEFDFLADRARRTENAASARSSALPRGGKPAIHTRRSKTNPANSRTAGLFRLALMQKYFLYLVIKFSRYTRYCGTVSP